MILLSNDDGIFAPGLQALAKELGNIDDVVAVAPDREQSATGTSVTLRLPLRVRRVSQIEPGVNTFAVEGSPSDSVILALEKIAPDSGYVISGINNGQNLGDDVLISGTVGAALQGYLRNLPAIAISTQVGDTNNLGTAARLVRLLLERVKGGLIPADVFFNINLPDIPLSGIKGIMVTELAHKTHIDTVEEGNDGRREYYWLVRRKLEHRASDGTDIWAVEHGYISITPLHCAYFQRPAAGIDAKLCEGLFVELKDTGESQRAV
jgi:5'-nucleotidase